MRAVAVVPGQKHSLHVRTDVPEPRPRPFEAVVRVTAAGVCGTDMEINEALYGRAPAGSDYLVLGHENLGVVDYAPAGSSIHTGDLVVSTVRRPCGQYCRPCLSGEQDMCVTGAFEERGIGGLHGFMSEAYVEDPFYLVKVPKELAKVAVLIEPLTIIEKGLDHAQRIQSRYSWEPKRALVLGAGAVGILAAAVLRLRGYEVTVAALSPEGLRSKILGQAGIQYISTEKTPIKDLPKAMGGLADVMVEATGAAVVVAPAIMTVASGGIGILTSVTGGSRELPVDVPTMNRDIVLGNRVIFGTVNAGRRHFEMAVKDLLACEQRLPGWLSQLITRRLPFTDAVQSMTRSADDIKTVLTFA